MAFAKVPEPPLAETFSRVSDAWVRRIALAAVLIAHGWCRQVVELLRDVIGASLSMGTIHAWVVQC